MKTNAKIAIGAGVIGGLGLWLFTRPMTVPLVAAARSLILAKAENGYAFKAPPGYVIAGYVLALNGIAAPATTPNGVMPVIPWNPGTTVSVLLAPPGVVPQTGNEFVNVFTLAAA